MKQRARWLCTYKLYLYIIFFPQRVCLDLTYRLYR